MTNPNADLGERIRYGRLKTFLRRDLFLVQLDDGITITAVMPEELFSMREPPALPKIIRAGPSGFCGPG